MIVKFFAAILLFLVALQPTAGLAATQKTILAGGCFWCVQHDLDSIPGIISTQAGYAGGDRPNPTYKDYHTLNDVYRVPHIEVVQVEYDDAIIHYKEILQKFMRKIDPTDGEGQFCDRGISYRPALFTATEIEKATAEQVLKNVSAALNVPIAVDILQEAIFWPAEKYHQHYAKKNPIRYNFYRNRCGRDKRIKAVWGKK